MHPAWAILGALPALIAMWVVDHMDRRRPEPRRTLRLVAVAGVLSVLPCVAIELSLVEAGVGLELAPGSYGHAAFHGFVVAAAPEELAKTLVLLILVWRRPEFDERMDGIVYATRAGLGFALIENVLYLHGATGDPKTFWTVFVGRALLAVPGHAIWAACIGYFAARRRFDRVGPGVVGGYLLAVLLHGSYDTVLFAAPAVAQTVAQTYGVLFLERYQWHLLIGLHVIPVGLTILGIALVRRMAHSALRHDDAAEYQRRARGIRTSLIFGVPPPGWSDEPRRF